MTVTVDVVAGFLLIVAPIAFNVAFFALARTFDYPNILRESPDTILRRFHAGGARLVLWWELLLLSALTMLPVAVLVVVVVGGRPGVVGSSVVFGVVAALVQALGLVRWPFVVPELARRYIAADGPDGKPARDAIEVVFATLHRLLGVGIGEHLGYLLTGVWTFLVTAQIVSTDVLPVWLAFVGVVIGVALVVGSLEFVGPNERNGWAVAGTIVPIAYLAWSVWLVVIGILLIVT
jgi:hypothetical protein